MAQTITIPNFAELFISDIVLDYNGTLAKDGLLKEQAVSVLKELCRDYRVHVITADTFGSVQNQLKSFDLSIKVLESEDHTAEKAAFVKGLGASNCAAVGNGNNDAQMLKTAAVGIALMGDEGCSTQTLLESDLVCHAIEDALELFVSHKRLIATLRR